MKLSAKTSKSLKRILGIAVPALVMLIAVIMVSVSFAWFSSDVKPTVQSINLTVGNAFSMSFKAEGDSSARNINYKGQTAIDKNGRLITDYNGKEYQRPNKVELNQYLLDMPYYFITTIELDTEKTEVTMKMLLDTVKISKQTDGNKTIINSYDNGDKSFSPDDIPYVFTWYFKERDKDAPSAKNYVGELDGDEDNRVMDNSLPVAGEEWYTPYGKLTFNESGLIAKVNGKDVNNTPVTDESDTEARYSLLNEGYKEMQLTADKAQYDFYIVFAPERLFWAQFCVADRALKVDKSDGDGIYNDDELVKIFGASSKYQMYYSSTAYYGATFEFGATLRVSSVDGRPV